MVSILSGTYFPVTCVFHDYDKDGKDSRTGSRKGRSALEIWELDVDGEDRWMARTSWRSEGMRIKI